MTYDTTRHTTYDMLHPTYCILRSMSPSRSLRSGGLDLAWFPCTSGAAGVEMVLPGGCVVKPFFTTNLLREKRNAEKKKTTHYILHTTHYILDTRSYILHTYDILHTTHYIPHTTYFILLKYYILHTTYCILHTAYCLLRATYHILRTTYHIRPTTCLLPTTYYVLSTTYYSTYYLLPATCYLLPTTYYLLPTTYYLLPTTYYLLPTTYYILHATCDVDHRLQSASKIFNANKWILCDTQVAIAKRLEYFDCVISPAAFYASGHRSVYKNDFDAVVSSVACFAGGHRTIYQEHIQTLDLHFRKFCRSIVGPPPYTDWTLEWHEILHAWNERAAHFVGVAKIQSWSRICCVSYWKLAAHIAKRPIHHWIQRILHWQPVGQRRLGRPKHRWESKLEMYCRYQGLVHWEEAAQNCELWEQHLNRFLDFCCQ